ncbi:MAG: hypothetical protein PHO26_04180 [Dehalococcoidia bacterium]|nr:hypothetical protein [Dehalococcoidia bacterium]MDD5493179.1 hypothetical protein [Dehalococcoidia bacterium]
MSFWDWFINILGIAYVNPNSWLSIVLWIIALFDLVILAISKWGLPKAKDLTKKISTKILKFAAPISVLVVFVCFIVAAYSSQVEQAKDLETVNKRVKDLEFGQALATQVLKQQSPAQLIRTATATVDIFVKSTEDIQTHDLGNGGYLGFGKGQDALLIMYAAEGYRNQQGNGTVRYRCVLNMDATSKATEHDIQFLKQAEYIQIGFVLIPKDAQVQEGSQAIITINNTIRWVIPIPPQAVIPNTYLGAPSALYVRNIQQYLQDTTK